MTQFAKSRLASGCSPRSAVSRARLDRPQAELGAQRAAPDLEPAAGPSSRGTRPGLVLGLAAMLLAACATTPADPVSEKLDPDTATTVLVLATPVEMLTNGGINRESKDPFAYLAPFQTNRMGQRALFLWISAPQPSSSQAPTVLCDGQPVDLPLLESGSNGASATPGDAKTVPNRAELGQLDLSQPPYDQPVPWNGQWYFHLSADALKCLAAAHQLVIRSQGPDGAPLDFTADGKSLAAVGVFAQRD